jgi:adenylosuccinate synthase
MLANGIVSPNLRTVLIGPGSVIDIDCLRNEITACADLLRGKVIVIHPAAVIVTQEHRDTEARNVKIGSTMKGTGAAVISRIERDPDNMPIARHNIPGEFFDKMHLLGVHVFCSAGMYRDSITGSDLIQIEGAQGFSLSIYHGFYPYTTSRDVTPAQVMADCALPLSLNPDVYGTIRTYPIRVANRYDADGNMIGTSGPCYDDQREMQWSELGMQPELTTVTKLPRRIFTFSYQQLKEAIFHCAPIGIFLNFANYQRNGETLEMITKIEDRHGEILNWVGTGPSYGDVVSSEYFISHCLKGQE